MFQFSGRDLLSPFLFRGRLLNNGVFPFVAGRTLTLGRRYERSVLCKEERQKTKQRKERMEFHEKRKMRIMKREKSLGVRLMMGNDENSSKISNVLNEPETMCWSSN